jgi:hypothetical protein
MESSSRSDICMLHCNVFQALTKVIDSTQAMKTRAIKHLVRQDNLLLQATVRIWKAHERWRLLERVKAVRLVKDAWAIWRRRLWKEKQSGGVCQHVRQPDQVHYLLTFTVRPRYLLFPSLEFLPGVLGFSNLASSL